MCPAGSQMIKSRDTEALGSFDLYPFENHYSDSLGTKHPDHPPCCHVMYALGSLKLQWAAGET